MAVIQPVIKIELDPKMPVPEILTVLSAVMPYHPGQEEAILQGVQEAINQRLAFIRKGAEVKDA